MFPSIRTSCSVSLTVVKLVCVLQRSCLTQHEMNGGIRDARYSNRVVCPLQIKRLKIFKPKTTNIHPRYCSSINRWVSKQFQSSEDGPFGHINLLKSQTVQPFICRKKDNNKCHCKGCGCMPGHFSYFIWHFLEIYC